MCLQLFDLYPEAMQVRTLGLESADDRTIWEYARNNDFILVSQDADFAELAALRGSPPKVIWLRCGNQPTSTIEHMLREHAEAIAAFAADPASACFEIY